VGRKVERSQVLGLALCADIIQLNRRVAIPHGPVLSERAGLRLYFPSPS
jgi:hypothetical protein